MPAPDEPIPFLALVFILISHPVPPFNPGIGSAEQKQLVERNISHEAVLHSDPLSRALLYSRSKTYPANISILCKPAFPKYDHSLSIPLDSWPLFGDSF